jgi:undecaprenyl-diphosphatase
MSNLEALLLGVVQGLTEFLPIPSSGHLIVVPWLQDYTFLTTDDAFTRSAPSPP